MLKMFSKRMLVKPDNNAKNPRSSDKACSLEMNLEVGSNPAHDVYSD